MERRETKSHDPTLTEATFLKDVLTRRGKTRLIKQQYQPPTLDDIGEIRGHLRYILVTHDDPTGELPKVVGIIEAELEKEISPATQRQKQKDQDISNQKNRREALVAGGFISVCAAFIGAVGWGIKELVKSENRRIIDHELTHTLNLNPSQPSRSGWRIRHLHTEEGVIYVENPNAEKISLVPKQHIFLSESDNKFIYNTFIYLEVYKSSNSEILVKLVVEGLGRNQEWIIDAKPIKGINNQVIAFDDAKTSKSTWFSVKLIGASSFELIPVKRISQ